MGLWGALKKAVNSDLSVPLNEKIMNRRALFTSNGTFIVPKEVTMLKILACASGDDGADGSYASTSPYGCLSGGAGGEIFDGFISVTPGESISVTVGAGNTVFGSKFTLLKGGGCAAGVANLYAGAGAGLVTANGGGAGIGGGGGGGGYTAHTGGQAGKNGGAPIQVHPLIGWGGGGGGGGAGVSTSGAYNGGAGGIGGGGYAQKGGAGGASANNGTTPSVPGSAGTSGYTGLGAGAGGAAGAGEETPNSSGRYATGGSGGGGAVGNGGDGGSAYILNSTIASAGGGGGGGGAGSWGAGGGAGGGVNNGTATYDATMKGKGGKGGQGIVLIEW